MKVIEYEKMSSLPVVSAFTDAACFNNGKKLKNQPQHSCSACVFIVDESVIYGNYHFNIDSTNSYGELIGVYLAIRDYINLFRNAEKYPQLVISSDSGYVVNSLNIWIYGWRKNAVNGTSFNSSNNEVSYYAMIDEMRNLMDQYGILIKHVKGHVNFNVKKDINKAIKACKNINGYEPSLYELKRNAVFNDIVDRYAVKTLKEVMSGNLRHFGNSGKEIKRFRQFAFE